MQTQTVPQEMIIETVNSLKSQGHEILNISVSPENFMNLDVTYGGSSIS